MDIKTAPQNIAQAFVAGFELGFSTDATAREAKSEGHYVYMGWLDGRKFQGVLTREGANSHIRNVYGWPA